MTGPGPEPTVMVVTTELVLSEITETELEFKLATYTMPFAESNATPNGPLPTVIVLITWLELSEITETERA